MKLNRYQRALVRTYDKGAFAHIGQIDDPTTIKAAIDGTDDLVFQDIMAGLGSPDCDSNEKAIEIIRNARPRVQRLLEHAGIDLESAPRMAA